MLTGQSDVCLSVHSLLTVYSVGFSLWDYTTVPCLGNYTHLSAFYRNMPEINSVPQCYSDYKTLVIVHNTPWVRELTQSLFLCQLVLLMGMCEYLD